MVFETQFYEIWEWYFNMKNNIVFMHSEPIPFFVPRLPFRSPSLIKKIGYSGAAAMDWSGAAVALVPPECMKTILCFILKSDSHIS